MHHPHVSSGSISICDICFNLCSHSNSWRESTVVLSTWGFVPASLLPTSLPPFCLGKVLIFAQIKEALAAGKKKTWFSRRVSLATFSGCTQFKMTARKMIYIVKIWFVSHRKRGFWKLGSPAWCAVTDVKLSAVFRNFSRMWKGLQGEFWVGERAICICMKAELHWHSSALIFFPPWQSKHFRFKKK